MNEAQKSGPGCLQIGGIGCLVLFVLLLAGGLFAKHKLDQSGGWKGLMQAGTQKFGAEILNTTATALLEEMKFPEEDRAAIMVPIGALGEKISRGDVSVDQAMAVLEALFEGPVMGLILTESFRHAYMANSGLPPEELEAGYLTINRVQQGLLSETVTLDQVSEMESIVTTKNSSGESQLKPSITDAELKACLAILKTAADEAEVPMARQNMDLASVMQTAIDTGLTTGIQTNMVEEAIDTDEY
jgi:hypothetical protein